MADPETGFRRDQAGEMARVLSGDESGGTTASESFFVDLTRAEERFFSEVFNNKFDSQELLEETQGARLEGSRLFFRSMNGFDRYLNDLKTRSMKPYGEGTRAIPPRLRANTLNQSIISKVKLIPSGGRGGGGGGGGGAFKIPRSKSRPSLGWWADILE